MIGEPIKSATLIKRLEIDLSEETKKFLLEALQADPVKHGEWEQHDGCVLCEDDDTYFYTCSCCKMAITEAERGLFNFCPNCGAKMDKD